MEPLKRFRYSTYDLMVTDEEYPPDQATCILTLHISTEYWLDRLLQRRCSLNEEELDSFDLTYYKKLSVLLKIGMVPNDIFQNLKALNELRNRFAHRLDYVLGDSESDFNFRHSGVDFDRFWQQVLAQPTREGIDYRGALLGIGEATLETLETYCTKDARLSEPDEG